MIDKAWRNASSTEPCPVCEKPDWCSISHDGSTVCCRRVESPLARIDSAGEQYFIHFLDEEEIEVPDYVPDLASPEVRDRVYRALLQELGLNDAHKANLKARGLWDGEIAARSYGSLPLRGRSAVARRLVDEFGADDCLGVPGFRIVEPDEGNPFYSLAGAPGILIPVRDLHGRVVGCKIRRDDGDGGPRYTTLSSTTYDGPGPGRNVHVPLHAGLAHDVVRVTEGELKSDISTALSGVLTISLPGVNSWTLAAPALHQLDAQRVLVAFDTDARTNPAVARALRSLVNDLRDEGFGVELEELD